MKPETSNELRSLVQEVLRETLASRKAPVGAQGIETIRISTDAELQAFINRLASPGMIEAVRSGKQRFTLGHATAVAGPAIAHPAVVLEGVITEHKLAGITGGTIILGPTAVLTPLARDKARKAGLKIERKR